MNKEKEARLRELYNKMSKEELVNSLVLKVKTGSNHIVADTDISDIKDDIKNNIHEVLLEMSKDKNFVRKFLLNKDIYSNNSEYYTPTTFSKEILTKVVDEKFISIFREELLKYLTTHFDNICRGALKELFINGLTNDITFIDSIGKIIEDKL